MAKAQTELKGGWHVELDPDCPCESLRVCRGDGRFFRVVFSSELYGQPVIEETLDDDGLAGYVIPIVKNIDGQWHVAVTDNDRPANFYEEPLVEGARTSASNDSPFLTTDGLEIEQLPGHLFANSARIAGKIRTGIVDVTDSEKFELQEDARFISFGEFFDQSTDSLTKACLGHFMVKVLGHCS